MKKVDLNFDIINTDGVKVSLANKLISGLLMSEMKGDAEKMFDWAMCFSRGEVVSMDDTDFERFKEFVSKTERLVVMVKVPILRYLKTLNN